MGAAAGSFQSHLAAGGTGRGPGAELVPIRYERMCRVAVCLLPGRGLRHGLGPDRSPRTGIRVRLCGDAHLSNFGAFASPERHLLFDLNDFDETLPGPWEWDLKRLAASVAVASRRTPSRPSDGRIVRELVGEYGARRAFAAVKSSMCGPPGAALRPSAAAAFDTAGDRGQAA